MVKSRAFSDLVAFAVEHQLQHEGGRAFSDLVAFAAEHQLQHEGGR